MAAPGSGEALDDGAGGDLVVVVEDPEREGVVGVVEPAGFEVVDELPNVFGCACALDAEAV